MTAAVSLTLYGLIAAGYLLGPVRRHRLLHSPFAAHVRGAVRSRSVFWSASIGSGVILGVTALAYLQSLTPVTAIR